MLALGGKPFPCLGVLKRWRDMHTWAMSAELFHQMQARLGPDVVLPAELAPVHELGLMLTWERTWRRSAYYSEHERLLLEQLRKRALPALREHLVLWRSRSGARLISSAQVRVLRPGQPPAMEGSMDSVRVTATAALGVSWIHRVWGRGLAAVDDGFVLEVADEEASGDELAVRAVRWEEQRPGAWSPVIATARVGLDGDGRWRLRWDEGRVAEAAVGQR
jgi:hypothetical protein